MYLSHNSTVVNFSDLSIKFALSTTHLLLILGQFYINNTLNKESLGLEMSYLHLRIEGKVSKTEKAVRMRISLVIIILSSEYTSLQ